MQDPGVLPDSRPEREGTGSGRQRLSRGWMERDVGRRERERRKERIKTNRKKNKGQTLWFVPTSGSVFGADRSGDHKAGR